MRQVCSWQYPISTSKKMMSIDKLNMELLNCGKLAIGGRKKEAILQYRQIYSERTIGHREVECWTLPEQCKQIVHNSVSHGLSVSLSQKAENDVPIFQRILGTLQAVNCLSYFLVLEATPCTFYLLQ